MHTHRTLYFVLFFMLASVLSACFTPPPPPTPITLNIVRIERLGQERRPYGDVLEIPLPNCGGSETLPIDKSQSVASSVIVNVQISFSVGGQLGNDVVGKLEAEIAAQYGVQVGQQITWTTGGRFAAAPGTHIIYDVQFIEVWQLGQVLLADNTSIPFEILTAVDIETRNSRNIPCPSGGQPTVPAPTAPSVPNVSPTPLQGIATPFEDFSQNDWVRNATRWNNITGICTYSAEGGIGVLAANTSGFCTFALVDPDSRSEAVPMGAVGSVSARVALAEGSAPLDQGLGLYYAPSSWFSFCGLRKDGNATYTVFEVSEPVSTFNKYAVTQAQSAQVILRVRNNALECAIDNAVFGTIPLDELPFAATAFVARTFNSNRPTGNSRTTLDDVYLVK